MPTPSERRALLFVAAVAALGLGVRGARALRPVAPPPDARRALADQLAAVDSAVSAGGHRRAARPAARASGAAAATPKARAPRATSARMSSEASAGAAPVGPAAPSAPIDVDVADEAALDALPGVGPALARRIVESRNADGPFGSLDGLQQVRGIGPALAARLAPHVRFSGRPRAPATSPGGKVRPHP